MKKTTLILTVAMSVWLFPHVRDWGGAALAQQCNIIYVTTTGASSGAAGTITNPANLTYGLSLANSTNNQLWLAAGNYAVSTTLNMISDVTLDGGFDPVTWIKSNLLTSVINRDNTNVLPSPNRLVAISCVGISNFRLQDITVNVANAVGNSVTTYGIYVSGCSDYSITRCEVNAGNGSDGVDGVSGANGIGGANGANGQGGDGNGGCCTAGGAGGSGSFPGSNAGGNGGDGGARGTGTSWCGGTAPDGSPGQNGGGTGGGAGGAGGDGYCQPACASFGCDAGPANAGDNGLDGANGINGIDGLTGVPTFGVFFIPGDGQDGQDGEHGSGGGGGGGGGSQGCLWALFGNYNGAGAGGGGGGEGGQGGFGATGGTGGGGSFGIYINANGTNTEIKDCYLNSGVPGFGGLGGSPGGIGANGGTGGLGNSSDCDLGDPGDGGNGGNGANGGNGGNGTPGISLPIYEDPAGLATAQSDMSSPVEPEIFVKSTGCTWSDIEFTTNATGIVLWYFDGGTTPLSGTGDSVTVQYTTMGRHTITLVVDGVPYIFTDFVGIFNDGTPYLPDIISSDSVICPGNTASFASSYAGLTYEWVVYDNSPITYTTALINHTFNDTGTYDVTLQTTSPCCDKSKIDTFIVYVVPYLIADVFVSVTSASICDGDQTTFGAMPVNGGPNPTYLWQVNGGAAGDSTNSFTTSTLNDGDVVTCIMMSSYTCPIGSPAISLPITINVNPLPIVNCSANRFYLGANTIFTATPAQGTPPYTYNWDFGDSGIDTGATTSHYYGSTGTYYYSVTITDSNGCTGYCSDSLTIDVAPFVAAGFDNNNIIQICDSTTVAFIDTSLGNPDAWYWDFGDGDTSTLQNPTHTYNSPGSYSVTLAATNGVYTDTVTYPNYVVVYASPIAGLSALEQAGCQPFNSQFLDESYGATSWQWDFGDPLSSNNTSTFQNPNHSYTDTGLYSVVLIVGSNCDTDGICICYDTAYMSIYVKPSPVAGFTSVDTLVCVEADVQFTDMSIGAISWDWDFGDGGISTDTNPSYIYNYSGIYTVSLIVENQFGCSDTLTRDSIITVMPNPTAAFTAVPQLTTIMNPAIVFTDESTDSIISWSWGLGDDSVSTEQNLSHTYMDTGSYTIQLLVIDENGCRDSVSDVVKINPDYVFFIPTAFTPDNKDNTNDEFFPKGIGINETDFHMYIYTRWGELVFETTDIEKHWDGRALNSSELVQTDIYVWKILTKDMLGQKHEYVGHVTLIR